MTDALLAIGCRLNEPTTLDFSVPRGKDTRYPIVGAALLMRVETSFTIFGLPGIAAIFFLLSGVAGRGVSVTLAGCTFAGSRLSTVITSATCRTTTRR